MKIRVIESQRNFSSDRWHLANPRTLITEQQGALVLALNGQIFGGSLEELFTVITGWTDVPADAIQEGTGPLPHHKGLRFFLLSGNTRLRISLQKEEPAHV